MFLSIKSHARSWSRTGNKFRSQPPGRYCINFSSTSDDFHWGPGGLCVMSHAVHLYDQNFHHTGISIVDPDRGICCTRIPRYKTGSRPGFWLTVEIFSFCGFHKELRIFRRSIKPSGEDLWIVQKSGLFWNAILAYSIHIQSRSTTKAINYKINTNKGLSVINTTAGEHKMIG